jgi:hypothetical protein
MKSPQICNQKHPVCDYIIFTEISIIQFLENSKKKEEVKGTLRLHNL